MKIAILDDYQDVVKSLPCFKLLEAHDVTVFKKKYTEAELLERLWDVEALVLIRERTVITNTLLAKLPNLQVISQTGKVSHHIDPEMCERHGVVVLEGKGSPVAPSELCWALIMAASRHIPEYSSQLLQNRWQNSGVLGLGRTLRGLTLGIWGYGKIGQRIAQYAKAFDMSVLVWGSETSRALALEHGFFTTENKESLFAESDVLTLHLRLSEATKGCVKTEDLALMKQDSLFVNTSRAELVEAGALLQELSRVQSKKAAVDVYVNEPITLESEPLLMLPNVTATPHIGYVEQNSYELYFRIAFENILKFEQGARK